MDGKKLKSHKFDLFLRNLNTAARAQDPIKLDTQYLKELLAKEEITFLSHWVTDGALSSNESDVYFRSILEKLDSLNLNQPRIPLYKGIGLDEEKYSQFMSTKKLDFKHLNAWSTSPRIAWYYSFKPFHTTTDRYSLLFSTESEHYIDIQMLSSVLSKAGFVNNKEYILEPNCQPVSVAVVKDNHTNSYLFPDTEKDNIRRRLKIMK